MSDEENKKSLEEEIWKDDDFLSLKKDTADDADEASDDDMELSSSSSDDQTTGNSLPPWLERPIDYRRVHPLTALHNEIVNFSRLMEPMPEEKRKRDELVTRIRGLVSKAFGDEAEVQVFGSQATGLFLPSSDIDLVVITKKGDDTKETHQEEGQGDESKHEEQDWKSSTGTPLRRFAEALRDEWLTDLSYLEVIENTRVPLVKFTHAPTNVSVDVCFDQPLGPPAAQLMKTYLDALPPLRPLIFVLKYFLAARGLNEPYSGGVGSFMLQLLIVGFLQARERDAVKYRRSSLNNLGSLLLEFFELYGLEFNYITTGLSVRHDGFFFPKGAANRRAVFWQPQRPFMCALENPLDTSMDVGKSSFRIQTVQRAFAVAYKMLLAHVAEPVQPVPSILATILQPTNEMVQRRWYKRRSQPLSAKRHSSADAEKENGSRKRPRTSHV